MLRISSDLWAEPTWHRSHPAGRGSGRGGVCPLGGSGTASWILKPGAPQGLAQPDRPRVHAHEQRYKRSFNVRTRSLLPAYPWPGRPSPETPAWC